MLSLCRPFVSLLVLFSYLPSIHASCHSSESSIGPKGDLIISNKRISPDGLERDAVLAGGQYPGPLIKGYKGDNFQINVTDQLTDESMSTFTSIHWHGIKQRHSIWSDGTAFVTQCPIVSGNSFLYNFSVPDQAGTFWYHSHVGVQYCDGLRGPLVIYDHNDPHKNMYDVDDESTIIALAEWYHVPAPQIGIPPLADSTLFNGRGRQSNGSEPLTVFTVQRGKRYRMRLIAMSCEPNYIFSIDQHIMTVIEADGTTVEPVNVDSLQIFAAQRYSFVLEANQPVNNYWMRAQPDLGVNVTTVGGVNSAILRYEGAPEEEPTTTQSQSKLPLLETSLHPFIPMPVPGAPHPGGAEVVKNLDIQIDMSAGRYTVNNVSFVPPSIPVLLQLLSGARSAQDLMPSGSIIPLPRNATVEITMRGGALGGPHPMHMHSNTFHVVRSAGNSSYNFVNPIVRDTVNIGEATDEVTIRFDTTTPGPWIFHCHINLHLQLGLAVVMAEAVEDIANDLEEAVPTAWKDLCPAYNKALPAGNQTVAA
ncbi:multicopper oxidase [Abortiporus biennis]|nr:multicopper oxidase [Abortiporus biennis]